MKYELYNDETNETEEIIEAANFDDACEKALFQLSCRVEPKNSEDKIKKYFVVSDCGHELYKFSEYLYERACIEALSLLGYSLFEEV